MPSRAPSNVAAVLQALETLFPDAACELVHETPFELLVSTILSAQCTDAQVNKVTPALFERWPDARSLAGASLEEIEAMIHSTGFYRAKARNLKRTAELLVERHGGEVPRDMTSLVGLAGVARKTANVVLGTAYGIHEGVVVDTHVLRITRRWGWHEESAPERVERILMEILPRETWGDFDHRAVLFGRYRCPARKPPCETCPIRGACPVGQGHARP